MFSEYRFCALLGLSGVGKSARVDQLLAQGEQVLSIEHLLEIRGYCLKNIFDTVGVSREEFRGLLDDAFKRLDPGRPVYVEWKPPELMGVELPEALIGSVRAGAFEVLECPREERIDCLVKQYSAWREHQAVIVAMLSPRLAAWQRRELDNAVGDDPRLFVDALLRVYFDPLYHREISHFRDNYA